eukprot:c25444_g1_i1 orf=98-310(+)
MKKTMRQSVTVSALLKTKTYKSSAPLHDRRPGPHIQTCNQNSKKHSFSGWKKEHGQICTHKRAITYLCSS